MKLVCPKCQAKLKIPDQQIPATGAWAKCPKCQERFFINPAAQSAVDLTTPFQRPNQAPAPLGRRDSSAQQLIERVRAKRGLPTDQRRDAFDESGLVMVYPKPAVSAGTYQAIGLALLAVPILFIVIFFSSLPDSESSDSSRPKPAEIVTKINDINSNHALIRQDLLNIRKGLVNRPRPVYGAGYSTSETRVFNYFVANMLPEDICSRTDYTEVTRLTSAYGFTAKGRCLQGKGNVLELRVEWTTQKAMILFPYYQAKSEFDLYP